MKAQFEGKCDGLWMLLPFPLFLEHAEEQLPIVKNVGCLGAFSDGVFHMWCLHVFLQADV